MNQNHEVVMLATLSMTILTFRAIILITDLLNVVFRNAYIKDS